MQYNIKETKINAGPVGDSGSKATSGCHDTDDVLCTESIYGCFHRLNISSQFIAFKSVLQHNWF